MTATGHLMRPGAIVTLDPVGRARSEKGKERPAVVVHDFGQTKLVVPICDADKRRLPVHHFMPQFNSGSQVKDALATAEHSIAASPHRLLPRAAAPDMDATNLKSVKDCLQVAIGLMPAPAAPPGKPAIARGSFVVVDFGSQPGPEAIGTRHAIVISNDTGNYFGTHYLVVPLFKTGGIHPVMLASGPMHPALADLGRLRVIDLARIDTRSPPASMTAEDLSLIGEELRNLLS